MIVNLSDAIIEPFSISGDGRWRQVIRRCAAVSDTGVTGVCNWGVLENGVYWEECYCSSDGCNGAFGALRFVESARMSPASKYAAIRQLKLKMLSYRGSLTLLTITSLFTLSAVKFS